jgi:hypothetical protein
MNADIDFPQTISLALGQTPENAKNRIRQEIPIDGEVEILISPDWWPRLPLLPFQIQIFLHQTPQSIPETSYRTVR